MNVEDRWHSNAIKFYYNNLAIVGVKIRRNKKKERERVGMINYIENRNDDINDIILWFINV